MLEFLNFEDPKFEDCLVNFEGSTLIFKEIEDSFMCREPQKTLKKM